MIIREFPIAYDGTKAYDATRPKLTTPEGIYELMTEVVKGNEQFLYQEHFYTIGLNIQSVLVYLELNMIGTISEMPVRPLNILRIAVIKGAPKIINIHNHPSGDPEPSFEDIQLTKKLKISAETMGIEYLDHIIMGANRFVSMERRNL